MKILGISPLDKDATGALYIDGKWTATAEERLSRVKLQSGFPKKSISQLLKLGGLSPEDLDCVVYPFMPWWVEGLRIMSGYFFDLLPTLVNNTSWPAKSRHLKSYWDWSIRSILEHRKYHAELVAELHSLGLDRKLKRIEHHTAHAASAYLTSGFEQALAVTLDWYGGGLSGSVSRCAKSGIKRIHNFYYPHSLGLFYAQVTSALGFKASQHEGKIVGLAAYGDPNVAGARLFARFQRKAGNFRYQSGMDPELAKNLASNFPREHIAAAYQYVLEILVSEIVSHWMKVTGMEDVVLAGGVAANVKMNQRIAELQGVRRVFVHPNMGDGGTGIGAILSFLSDRKQITSKEWETCYLGPSFSKEQIQTTLESAGLHWCNSEKIAKEVAHALADGKVVARFSGPMEYGPRALGNRSILYSATHPDVNQWLNKKLGRTEFMPFAPVTMLEHSRDRYLNIDKCLASSRFMTITCECTDLMKKESPAAVHVDGTARPQILRREDNPDFYSILEEYYKLTGVPTLINTSFNMHEEPIVCTPEDAVRAFLQADLDLLCMGSILVRSKSEQPVFDMSNTPQDTAWKY
jgi:carbamoyltransferase